MILGQALAYAPNLNTAISSGARILRLVDRKPKMKNPDVFPGISYDVSNY
jgi:ATP-binding cassette subfamily B (MDR/TAP) protein 1